MNKTILYYKSIVSTVSGLIIDAFGELRDQLDSVKENMESNCFICGIGKDYFDTVPHGFDTHVAKEHNLANYMWVLFTIPETRHYVCVCVCVCVCESMTVVGLHYYEHHLDVFILILHLDCCICT